MSVALATLPLALVIATGYGLAKSGIIPRGQWGPIETLSFRALIPAVLILAIMDSDLSFSRFGGFITALLVTIGVVGGCVLLLRSRLGNPKTTSVFQLGVRWNAFVALAAAELFIGTDAFGVIAVGIAVLIPVINVLCILVLAGFGPKTASAGQIARTVIKNPLVQACAIGLALNLSNVTVPQPLVDALNLIGRGGLGVGLLAVGAGISLRRLTILTGPLALSVFLRPILAPLVFLAVATAFDLNALQIFSGVLIIAAPAATNGYIVAKQMGGDADLYADGLTWQTVICILVLPLWGYALI